MIVPGILVGSSFLVSVCMFIVAKALLILSATVIIRAGGTIWLNPFATVLFTVCSASLLYKEEDSSPVSIQLLRGGTCACMRCPRLCLCLGFGMGTMLANIHMCDIILVLRAVFNMLVRNASPRGPNVF